MRHRLAAVTVAASLALAPVAALAEDRWVTKTTVKSVEDTVADLVSAIEGAGARVMATVDHAENAEGAGLDLPATTVVIFGNPEIGTPLMQENRRIAIDLPQKMLIWDDDGTTTVGYVEPADLAARYGIPANSQSVMTMESALGNLSDAATAAGE